MELKLEDLFVNCEKCNGTGKLDPITTSSGGGMRVTHTFGGGNCDECRGAGGKLTSTGKVLKQFAWILKTKDPL